MLNELKFAELESYSLPYDLKISTATITCKMPNIKFNVANIAYYFNDFDNKIIGKKYGDRVINNLVSFKKISVNKKKKKREKKNFFNQVSLIFNTNAMIDDIKDENNIKNDDNKDNEDNDNTEIFCEEKNINVKLFINGSIQMTGCKNLDNITKCLLILFEKLKKTKAIWNEDFTFTKKTFIEAINTSDKNIDPITYLNVSNITNFKIRMINTNFNVGFQINREKLYHLLIDDDELDVFFDPIIHACVNIKYTIKNNVTNIKNISDNANKTVSIFVFESGSITIAGANSSNQILETYNFINKLILSNYNILLSKPITPHLILKLIKNIN